MIVAVYEGEEIRVPKSVKDLPSFRKWRDALSWPNRARVCFLPGAVEVDFSDENPVHHDLRCGVAAVLGTIARGRYLWRGEWLASIEGNFATRPDGMYLLAKSLQERRITSAGPGEWIGSPDMVLEVVTRSTVTKDTTTLREVYAVAGISEYWLIDPREMPLTFDLLILCKGVYRQARAEAGWQFSPAFSRWFRVVPVEQVGFASFKLESRTERP
jgi:hypothetical protein